MLLIIKQANPISVNMENVFVGDVKAEGSVNNKRRNFTSPKTNPMLAPEVHLLLLTLILNYSSSNDSC